MPRSGFKQEPLQHQGSIPPMTNHRGNSSNYSSLSKSMSYSHSSTSMSSQFPLSSPKPTRSIRKPQVRLLPPINAALVEQNSSKVRGIPSTTSFSSSAFIHVSNRVSCSSVEEQTTETGIKTSKPTNSSNVPQLGSSSSTIVSIQSPSSNVSNTSSFIGFASSSSSSSIHSSSTPPYSMRTSPPPRNPRPVKLSNAPSTNAHHTRVSRPISAVAITTSSRITTSSSSSRVTSMDLAAAHHLPSANSLKRSAAVADLNLVQQPSESQQENADQSDATVSEDIDNAQPNMDCDSSHPATTTCYFEPINAATLPGICPLQLPATVTQQLPTNGMMELYIPHVLFLPSNFNSPLFVSHGQCWNIGFIRQPALTPAVTTIQHPQQYDLSRDPSDDCMEQIGTFETPVLVDAHEAEDFGFCLALRNECFDSPNLNKLVIHSLTTQPHTSYQSPEFSCKVGVSSDRSSLCTFLHPPPPPPPEPEHSGHDRNRNKSSTPPPTAAMTPTWFINSGSIATGHMFIRPTILFTLIHPSGDASRNRRWMSHPQQLMDFHLNHAIEDGFLKEFDNHLLTNAFGVSRAISRADLVANEFLDSGGGILLRVEIMHAKSYAWSIPMDLTVPTHAAIARYHAANSPSFRNNGPQVNAQASNSGTMALTRMTPIATISHQSQQARRVHFQQHPQQQYSNSSYSLSPPMIQQLSSPQVIVAETIVTSSHLMMHNYEFYLKLHSQIVLSQTTGEYRFRNFTVSLVLHPRHMYRLQEKEEMSVRVDAIIQIQPTHFLSPSNPTSTCITDSQLEKEHDSAMESMVQHQFVTLLNSRNPAITLPYQLIQSSMVQSCGATTSQSLSTFSDLQVQVHFNSVGVVWSVSQFMSLCCQRKISPMFRLQDLTWNLIIDPKSINDPRFVAIYLALDKTCAGAFCHGLLLCPVFTLTLLHPTNPSRNIIRKFNDSAFSFDQQIFGCSSFVERSYLLENGWFDASPAHSSTGALQIEVQVQSARIHRPVELTVDTPIGPHGVIHSMHSHEEQCQMQESFVRSKIPLEQWNPLDLQQRQPEPQVFLTHSSPLQQPQAALVIPPAASSSSSSPPLNSTSSSPYGPRSQQILLQSSASSRFYSKADEITNLTASSASPVVTPLLDYLGTHFSEEEWDSYALPVQARRFGAEHYDGNNSEMKNAEPLYDNNSCPPPCSPRPQTASMEVQQHQHAEPIDPCETRMCSPPPPLELPPSQLSLIASCAKRHILTTTTRHGYICIIRCSQFSDSKLPQLIGYEVDEDRLLNTFLHALHCDVEVHLNIGGAEINRVFKVLSLKDFSSYDYLGVFILTHGVDSNTVYAGDGVHIAVNDIFTLFRGVECKSLAGKPKLFFVQACRGSAVDYSAREGSGVPNLNASNNSAPPQPTQQPPPSSSQSQQQSQQPPQPIEINRANVGSLPLQYTLDFPNESDFLYASSCVPGYISWTNTATGSWYISALCNVLLSYWPHMHLGDILLRVNFAVSKQNKLVDRYGSVYQIAAPTFTLRKKLYLHHTARKQQLKAAPVSSSLRGNHNAVNASSSSTNSTTSLDLTH